MATKYTQDDWQAIFDQAEKNLPTSPREFDIPDAGSAAFAKTIDHTLLKIEATQEQIDSLCEEAKKHKFYNFKSVCVRLNWVKRAVERLEGSDVVVACVVGFHEGTQSSSEKAKEATDAIDAGAQELDMVLNYPLLQQTQYSTVYSDILAVRNAAPPPIILKVILETSQLSRTEIIAACKIAEVAKADFVKTSTGFKGEGATVENVRLMKSVVGEGMKVKASGGVRSFEDAVAMMEAGAERIGTSNGVKIMEEAKF